MSGIVFYNNLRANLVPGQALSNNGSYTFVNWSRDGKLIYNVNNATKQPQKKRIPIEILVVSKYWQEKNILINHNTLLQNAHNNYCTASVLNYLLENY